MCSPLTAGCWRFSYNLHLVLDPSARGKGDGDGPPPKHRDLQYHLDRHVCECASAVCFVFSWGVQVCTYINGDFLGQPVLVMRKERWARTQW